MALCSACSEDLVDKVMQAVKDHYDEPLSLLSDVEYAPSMSENITGRQSAECLVRLGFRVKGSGFRVKGLRFLCAWTHGGRIPRQLSPRRRLQPQL